MSLDVVADMGSVADEGTSFEVGYFLRQTVFDNEPDVVAGYCCPLVLISETGYVESSG